MMNNSKQRKAEKQKDELRKMCLIEENKTCAVCNMRGPLYVVLDFQTFVCSTCSAIHRSMQHKVKGITMSDFTDEEIAALRVGGNQRAAKVWKHGYRNATPRDEVAAKNFIRTCYHDRLFFNAAEYDALQNDIAVAALPPLVVLNSGALGDGFGASTQTKPIERQLPSQVEQPKPATSAPAAVVKMTSQFDGLDFFQNSSQMTSAALPATPAPSPQVHSVAQTAVDPFDSFFTSRQHSEQRVTATTGQSTSDNRNIGMSDLFGPSSTSQVAASIPTHQSYAPPAVSNFFQESAWQANPPKPTQGTANKPQITDLFAM